MDCPKLMTIFQDRCIIYIIHLLVMGDTSIRILFTNLK